jgi:predicted transcriptional regulator of viral defense system
MMLDHNRQSFSSYLDRLLSRGQLTLTPEQAEKDLGISRRAFIDAATKQRKKGNLIMPRRGFYVIVPPQYLALGTPPPSLFIDALMRHERRPYYVGLLKAAEIYGASHQAVMQYQVITDKRLPKIRVGRSVIVFYYRKDMDKVVDGLAERKTDTGFIKVSGLELTMLDLLRYPHAAAGLDNIATVLSDIGLDCDPDKLAVQSISFERTVIQRLGYLLDRLGLSEKTRALYKTLRQQRPLPWTELEPVPKGRQSIEREPVERDERWHVIVKRLPEIDE